MTDDLGDAVERGWADAWAALGADPATQVTDGSALRVLTPGATDLLLNAVLRFRLDRPVELADVEQIIAPFRAARRAMQWWLRLESAPPGLRDRLAELGLRPWDSPPALALPLAGWQPPRERAPVVVNLVHDPDDATDALRIVCDVFGAAPGPMSRWCVGNPHFTVYLARAGRAATAALTLHRVGARALFFNVATLPAWRGRGIATALMVRALADLAADGVTLATLTASPQAEGLYRRLGFVACGRFELWTPGLRLAMTLAG